jgi:hypothetical protein
VKNLNIHFSEPCLLRYLFSEKKWLDKVIKLREAFKYGKRINIVALDSIEELTNLIGIKVPEWVIGTYVGNCILMLDYELWKSRNLGTFAQIITHEFAHVIISDITKQKCPIWLNEGLALYFAEQYKTMYLSKTDSINDNIYELGYRDDCLYNISAKAVEKIIDKYGMEHVMQQLVGNVDFEQDEIFGIENMKRILKTVSKDTGISPQQRGSL